MASVSGWNGVANERVQKRFGFDFDGEHRLHGQSILTIVTNNRTQNRSSQRQIRQQANKVPKIHHAVFLLYGNH